MENKIVLWLILLPTLCLAQQTVDNINGFGDIKFDTPIESIRNKRVVSKSGNNIYYRVDDTSADFFGYNDFALLFYYNKSQNRITKITVLFVEETTADEISSMIDKLTHIVYNLEKIYGKSKFIEQKGSITKAKHVWPGTERKMIVELRLAEDLKFDENDNLYALNMLAVDVIDNNLPNKTSPFSH